MIRLKDDRAKIIHHFTLTTNSQMNGVRVGAVIVGKLELVDMGVCGVGPVDSQCGDVAVFTIGLPGCLSDEATMARAGGKDDVAASAATQVSKMPSLLWGRVSTEGDLEQGILSVLHPNLSLGRVPQHHRCTTHFHPDGLRLN